MKKRKRIRLAHGALRFVSINCQMPRLGPASTDKPSEIDVIKVTPWLLCVKHNLCVAIDSSAAHPA